MAGEYGNFLVGGWDDEDYLVVYCWIFLIFYMGLRFFYRYVLLQQCQYVLKDILEIKLIENV